MEMTVGICRLRPCSISLKRSQCRSDNRSVNYRQAAEVARFKDLRQFANSGFPGYGDDILRHDIGYGLHGMYLSCCYRFPKALWLEFRLFPISFLYA